MILNTIATLILHIIIIKKSLVRYNGSPIILTSYKKIPFMLITHSSFFNFKKVLNKYYWNSFMLLGKYINTRVINDFIFEYKEIFKRLVELVQKYLL